MLRKEKRSFKETFEKFKKAFAVWEESEDDSTDNEMSNQEVANLCLVAKEDDINEVHLEFNSLNDLQDDYNDLYEESLKLVNTNCMLRKQVALLTNEIEKSKKYVDEVTTKNNELNAKVLDLTKCLEKITKGQKGLDLLLESQRCVYNRARLGYNPLTKQKLYKNSFTMPPKTHKSPCVFCNTNGHTIYSYHVRKCVKKGLKTMWVPKDNVTNKQGPNKIWVSKTNV